MYMYKHDGKESDYNIFFLLTQMHVHWHKKLHKFCKIQEHIINLKNLLDKYGNRIYNYIYT